MRGTFNFRPLALVLERLRREGHDADALLERHGLKDAQPDALDRQRLCAFLEEAKQTLGDPFLGLSLAAMIPAGTYGVVEFCGRSAPDLGSTLAIIPRFARLMNASHFEFIADPGGGGRLVTKVEGVEPHVSGVIIETGLGVIWRFSKEMAPDAKLEDVSFAHPTSGDVERAAAFFGKTPRYGAATSALTFDQATLQLVPSHADAPLHRFLVAQAKALLDQIGGDTLVDKTRAFVLGRIGQGNLEIEDAAVALAMSVRTLQRKLAADGTSYFEIVDDVRKSLSERYLARVELSVSEIAYLLGYSDLRTYERAHQRWTGETPARWRRSLTR